LLRNYILIHRQIFKTNYPRGTALCNQRCEQLVIPLPSFEDSVENELPAGVVGAEFNGTTDGEEADGSGASTVKVRSSVVRFVASRVNTCKLKNTVLSYSLKKELRTQLSSNGTTISQLEIFIFILQPSKPICTLGTSSLPALFLLFPSRHPLKPLNQNPSAPNLLRHLISFLLLSSFSPISL
jgi:hypothetical protein